MKAVPIAMELGVQTEKGLKKLQKNALNVIILIIQALLKNIYNI